MSHNFFIMSLVPYSRKRKAVTFLAPAVARRAFRASPYLRYAKAGVAAGRFVMRNRGTFMKALAMSRRRRYSGKLRVRTMPAVKNTSKASATNIFQGSANQFPMGSLQVDELPWPSFTSSNSLDSRQKNNIFVKGIKICRQFTYIQSQASGNSAGPVELHYALLQLKDNIAPGSVVDEISNGFFRQNDSGTTRDRAFNAYTAISQWDMGKNCLALNPNRKFRVLSHTKRLINPRSADSVANKTVRWKIEKYHKLGKNFSFPSTNNTLPMNNRIIEVYWYNCVEPLTFPSDPSTSTNIETHNYNLVFFS